MVRARGICARRHQRHILISRDTNRIGFSLLFEKMADVCATRTSWCVQQSHCQRCLRHVTILMRKQDHSSHCFTLIFVPEILTFARSIAALCSFCLLDSGSLGEQYWFIISAEIPSTACGRSFEDRAQPTLKSLRTAPVRLCGRTTSHPRRGLGASPAEPRAQQP